mmetsp:Transcript_163498/g.524225  ORF Transcript_163498/g.524225 Transcript_163498/m.524225 type:complete len:290 (-) Transcript_163498:286-1155(-)
MIASLLSSWCAKFRSAPMTFSRTTPWASDDNWTKAEMVPACAMRTWFSPFTAKLCNVPAAWACDTTLSQLKSSVKGAIAPQSARAFLLPSSKAKVSKAPDTMSLKAPLPVKGRSDTNCATTPAWAIRGLFSSKKARLRMAPAASSCASAFSSSLRKPTKLGMAPAPPMAAWRSLLSKAKLRTTPTALLCTVPTTSLSMCTHSSMPPSWAIATRASAFADIRCSTHAALSRTTPVLAKRTDRRAEMPPPSMINACSGADIARSYKTPVAWAKTSSCRLVNCTIKDGIVFA